MPVITRTDLSGDEFLSLTLDKTLSVFRATYTSALLSQRCLILNFTGKLTIWKSTALIYSFQL